MRPNSYVGAGRYLLQQHLGDGGMGSVWAAWDREVGKHYALKFLTRSESQAPELWARLRQEILRAQELRNEHIVGFFDLVVVPGEAPFLKMEYVPGRNLEERRHEHPGGAMPWSTLSPLVPQLCDALEHAHDRGIVHCDIKPSNLMVDGLGQLKLADFGIAQLANSHEAGPIFGTKAYMSPQRLGGGQPQPSDDLYSVGATLYELLASEPPFVGEPLTARILDEPAEPLHERLRRLGLTVDVPIRVAQVVMRCLDKDPAARPRSARELSRLLSPAGVVSRAKPKPPPPPLAAPPPPPRPGDVRIPGAAPAPAALQPAPAPASAPPAAVPTSPGSADSDPGPAAGTPMRFPPPPPEPDGAPAAPGADARRSVDELGPVLFKVLGIAAVLILGAFAADQVRRRQRAPGTLQLRAMVEGLPANTPDARFTFRIAGAPPEPSTGSLTHALPVELSLPPGPYQVEVAPLPSPGSAGPPEPAQTASVQVLRSARVPLEFRFGKRTPSTPSAPSAGEVDGTLELTVTDLGFQPGEPRTQFSYRLDQAGTTVRQGTALHGDPTTVELPPGDYHLTVTPAPESAGLVPDGQPLARDLTVSPRTKGSVTLSWGSGTGTGTGTARSPATAPPPSTPAASPSPSPAPPPVPTPPVPGRDWIRVSRIPGDARAARFVWLGLGDARVWLAAHETTLGDFRPFAAEHPPGRGLDLPGPEGWERQSGLAWDDPGFRQDESHPVVGVNHGEAEAFCQWLTARDQGGGRLTRRQRYRLPTLAEVRHAMRGLPDTPAPNAANLAGLEVRESRHWQARWSTFPGHQDAYPHTSPAGAFPPTAEGLHDLIGNAAEWCGTWYSAALNDPARTGSAPYFRRAVAPEQERVVTGGSWFHEDPVEARPGVALHVPPDRRSPFIGFRLALEDLPEPTGGTP